MDTRPSFDPDIPATESDAAARAELDATLLRMALRFAVRAPSSHNSQPWLFRVEGPTVELFADRRRALPIVDPHGRELVTSCGAALLHLRVALRKLGWRPDVEILAEPHAPDLLARVRLGERIVPSDDDAALCDAIERRHTNRGAFDARPVPIDVLVALRDEAEAEGAWLAPIQEPERRHLLATLIAEADRAQWHDAAFRRELARWLRPNTDRVVDGMPGHALGMGDLAAHLGPLVVRTFDRGDGVAAHDRELAEGAPVLAVLGTPHDTPRDWLLAGEALARVLLRATTFGLAASFLNQPIEVEALRGRVRALVGVDGAPQLVLRIGHPKAEVRATPRRAVEDVLI